MLLSTYLIYLAFGGIVLSDMEWEEEIKAVELFHQKKQEFLRKHPTLNGKDLDAFLDMIKAAVEKGVKINGNKTYNPNWNFGGGVLYAASLLTTIGKENSINPSLDLISGDFVKLRHVLQLLALVNY